VAEHALARLKWADGHITVMNVDITAERVIIPSVKGNTWFRVTDDIDDEGYTILIEEPAEK
jgi:hypothetical protein